MPVDNLLKNLLTGRQLIMEQKDRSKEDIHMDLKILAMVSNTRELINRGICVRDEQAVMIEDIILQRPQTNPDITTEDTLYLNLAALINTIKHDCADCLNATCNMRDPLSVVPEVEVKAPSIPALESKETIEAKINEIFDDLANQDSDGEYRDLMTQELPDSEEKSDEILKTRAKFLLWLNRELRFNNMPKKAEIIEKLYFADRLKDKILWEIVYKWYSIIAVKFPDTHNFEEIMKKGDEGENEREKAANKNSACGSHFYLWAAGLAVNHEQNLEKFEEALKKAAEARSKDTGREYEGPEIAYLAANAKQVFETTIPLVQKYIAASRKEK